MVENQYITINHKGYYEVALGLKSIAGLQEVCRNP